MSGNHLDRGAERRRLLRAIERDPDRTDDADGADHDPLDDATLPDPATEQPVTATPGPPRSVLSVLPPWEEPTEDGDA